LPPAIAVDRQEKQQKEAKRGESVVVFITPFSSFRAHSQKAEFYSLSATR
jgi:hypothetical protein